MVGNEGMLGIALFMGGRTIRDVGLHTGARNRLSS